MYRAGRITQHYEFGHRCPEHLDIEFLLWIWSYPKRTRRGIVKLLDEERNATKAIWLRTPAQIHLFLANARGIER